MCRVDLDLALRLLVELEPLQMLDEIKPSELISIRDTSVEILAILRQSNEQVLSDVARNLYGVQFQVAEVLHLCSLAVQFLCLGFLSYTQAHSGAICPFFLDSPQKCIELHGNQDVMENHVQIRVELMDLSCMGDMLKSSVLAFSIQDAQRMTPSPKSYKFDLLASPEDLMDTWGPGRFVITSSSYSNK